MTENGKLAPGVFRNVLSHGLAMAIFPLIAFFLIKAIGFSGITAAVVAVIIVHICLVKFVLSAMKEDTSGGVGGFEKVAEKDD
ncbi:Oidioi.mRNA.OKI2018_I69.chr2.g6367.t1.cds [Oikopleura dioica]|uniref:Oidioi.mRNA.OKI2018_I69.chr2.g6367.t1.cds n=1 Tax=Oikopleura dioica TaxID=34765 RepID=A0ABN7T9U5_OIKDI|nr:Oidioi.mRNA.OKI2018_I69.chr2.g6367.t1.cds [Oikopleura dioica]